MLFCHFPALSVSNLCTRSFCFGIVFSFVLVFVRSLKSFFRFTFTFDFLVTFFSLFCHSFHFFSPHNSFPDSFFFLVVHFCVSLTNSRHSFFLNVVLHVCSEKIKPQQQQQKNSNTFIFRPLTSYNKRESCASSATTTTMLGLPSSNYASQRGSNGALHLYALPMPPRAISPLMQVNVKHSTKTKQWKKKYTR